MENPPAITDYDKWEHDSGQNENETTYPQLRLSNESPLIKFRTPVIRIPREMLIRTSSHVVNDCARCVPVHVVNLPQPKMPLVCV